MLCGKTPVKSGGGSTAAVYLNVYDLTAINGYAYWLGLGVYHSGVEGPFSLSLYLIRWFGNALMKFIYRKVESVGFENDVSSHIVIQI